MRALVIDPNDRSIGSIDYPDEFNTPMSTMLGAAEHTELEAGAGHVMLVRSTWRSTHEPGFMLDRGWPVAGKALLFGRSENNAWVDAVIGVEELRARISWVAAEPA